MEDHRSERAAVVWSFALFFCVLASWYVLRPLRDAMGLAAGGSHELERWFLLTLGLTFVGTPALSALVSRVPRRRAIGIAYRFFGLTLVAFYLLLRGGSPSPAVARAFFVWASVMNLFAISLAWTFMTDVFSRAQGIRLFGLIGGGGTLGAIAGSLVTAALIGVAGVPATILVAAALLECAVRCVGKVAAIARDDGEPDAAAARGGVLAWLRGAVVSRYLLGICAYLALFTFTSTILYFEQARIVAASVDGTGARALLFARMDLAVSSLTLLLQLFAVGPFLRFAGVGAALAALPLATLACFVALRFAPVLGVLVACQVARRALDLSFAKPAREVLFTVVEPENKYKAKSLIDTFVYRSGDAFGAIGFGAIPAPALAIGMAAICVAWAIVGVALGRARPPPP